MTFLSLTYGLFLIVFFGIYWIIPNTNWRLFSIVIASFIFYASWQIQYIPLLLITILFNYCLANGIGEPLDWRIANDEWNIRRLLLLWLGIIVNILLLFSFKYIPFLLNTLGSLYNLPILLESASWVQSYVIPPLGLSFFCFECIAYLIDIYRGAPGCPSILHFTAYKFFFPKLISGPITRYHNFINQFKKLQFPHPEKMTEGLWLIAIGAVKKALLADNLGRFVDLSFSNLQRAGSEDLWLATFAYGLQLYLDFSGYVDIAIGSAVLMGLTLPQNFDYPYFSTSIADFWRRWHITLGDWLRNYIYFPLGGSRVGLIRTCLNLFIIMSIAGIWHGAAWGFIVWGMLHGLGLIIHRITEAISLKLSLESLWKTIPGIFFSWFLTQAMVFGTWIFFRLPNFKDSGWLISHLWNYPSDAQFVQKVYLESLGVTRSQITDCLIAIGLLMTLSYGLNRGLKLDLNWGIKLVLIPLCFYAVWLLAPQGGLPYIYFDF
jgi:alginate O-acetyltransferase complex protein AlgI